MEFIYMAIVIILLLTIGFIVIFSDIYRERDLRDIENKIDLMHDELHTMHGDIHNILDIMTGGHANVKNKKDVGH